MADHAARETIDFLFDTTFADFDYLSTAFVIHVSIATRLFYLISLVFKQLDQASYFRVHHIIFSLVSLLVIRFNQKHVVYQTKGEVCAYKDTLSEC